MIDAGRYPTAESEPTQMSARVEIGRICDSAQLGPDWRHVESFAATSFFLSWDWVGNLLESLPPRMGTEVLRVYAGPELVAIAFLGRQPQHRHGFVRSRGLHLNETGVATFDALTMEHNGIISKPGFETFAIDALLGELAARDDWDEFHLSGLTEPGAAAWRTAALSKGLVYLHRWSKAYYVVDLDAARRAGKSYLDTLSGNTRYQIRRAMKTYANAGSIEAERPRSDGEARLWFDELVGLHQAQWRARGMPGAFRSEFALRFHRTLVDRGWRSGAVQLTRVRAGDQVLGYTYNLQRGGVLYNYQSGHVSERDGKLKPGLVCHAIVVEAALREGWSSYDLLMGGDHFKASLASPGGSMSWSVIQQPRLALRVEHLLRQGRQAWNAWRAKSDVCNADGRQRGTAP